MVGKTLSLFDDLRPVSRELARAQSLLYLGK